MSLHKIRLGTNENNTPLWHYYVDDPATPVVLTGPITGAVDVVHPDGTTFTYDVTEPVIEVFPGHELHLSDAIGRRYEEEGHPGHDSDKPFLLTPAAVSHDEDGIPSTKYQDTIEAHAGPGKDSSPAGILAAMTGSKKGGS